MKRHTFSIFLLISCLITSCDPNVNEQLRSSTVQRFDTPNSPVAFGVRVPANQDYFYSGGISADPDTTTTANDITSPENTYIQCVNALQKLEVYLKEAQLEMEDVISLRVYLVVDKNKDNQLDAKGWYRAYKQFFSTADNPNKAAITLVGVSSLANSGSLVEIEAVAIYK